MELQDLPKWTHVIPVLLGVAFALVGMKVFPALGLRNSLGPIIGLPVGAIAGFGILALYAKSKGK